jgi:hypothetical protein
MYLLLLISCVTIPPYSITENRNEIERITKMLRGPGCPDPPNKRREEKEIIGL